MSKYIGLTLGPIYKTFTNVRRTRHLWAASYLFSYLMRKIAEELLRREADYELILPLTTEDAKLDKAKGAGFYPDRLMLKIKDGQSHFDDFRSIITAAMAAIGQTTDGRGIPESNKLADYLLTYFVETDIAENENFVEVLNNTLEVLEQQAHFTPTDAIDLPTLLDALYSQKFHEAAGIAKRVASLPEISAADLVEIGPINFEKTVQTEILTPSEKDEDTFIQTLKGQFPNDFKMYHNYVAIVKADGDGIGKIINKIGHNVNQTKEFSRKLFKFSVDAVEKIVDYGGTPIYAGGDDLLFFAPVAYRSKNTANTDGQPANVVDTAAYAEDADGKKVLAAIHADDKPAIIVGAATTNVLSNENVESESAHTVDAAAYVEDADGKKVLAATNAVDKPTITVDMPSDIVEQKGNTSDFSTIFDLVSDIDAVFDGIMVNETPRPTMSYGIAITYYRFPLNEALELSDGQLNASKEAFPKNGKPTKNAISFKVLKHSGGSFGATMMKKGSNDKISFKDLFRWNNNSDDNSFLSSIQYKLNINQSILENILDNKERLDNFFENNFNEGIHDKKRQFLDSIKNLLHQTYHNTKNMQEDKENRQKSIASVHAMLRFAHFINSNDKENG
jgi:hypothetical protein